LAGKAAKLEMTKTTFHSMANAFFEGGFATFRKLLFVNLALFFCFHAGNFYTWRNLYSSR